MIIKKLISKLSYAFRHLLGMCLTLCIWVTAYTQDSRKNEFEIRIMNDNAGELSHVLNTGDDVGETHSSLFAYRNFTWSKRYNFEFLWESTEFSDFETITIEPRDLNFNELNVLN